jgi:opacity protein-like surface antigen
VFVEVAFSKFEETGERVFRANDETFRLGIPLTAKLMPFEVSGGYRFTNWRRVIPYGGIGFGSYHYEETSDFSQSGENVDVSKNGLVLMGGAEVRVMRWVGLSFDVHHTSIDDIIGVGGISQEFDETDLGGTAFRIRVMVGR